METVEATPFSRSYESNPKNPNPNPSSPSPSPSPSPSQSPSRLWRPAAQRNLRNQWPKLLASKDRWISAASQGRSHATALVNAYLSRKYMPDMDLGVLKDMPEIRQKACEKLGNKQMLCRKKLLLSYKDMVLAVSDLIKVSGSMRCFVKASTASPILQFSDHSVYENDSGDGGGVPVFLLFSVSDFDGILVSKIVLICDISPEKLAQELVEMFVLELTLKRLLVVELLSLSCEDGTDRTDSLEWSEELFHGEFDELRTTGLHSEECCQLLAPQTKDWVSRISLTELAEHSINREILQVYLTTWFANVNLNMSRIDEIFAIVEEEIQVKLL